MLGGMWEEEIGWPSFPFLDFLASPPPSPLAFLSYGSREVLPILTRPKSPQLTLLSPIVISPCLSAPLQSRRR